MSEKEFFVKKRGGKLEKFNPDKINKILQWATEGIKNVSFDEVAMNVHLSMFDGITSKDIHTSVIEAAAGLISEEKTNYQYVAGRLLNYQLRKSVWGGKNAPKFYDFIKRNIDANLYDKHILTWFTKQEIDKLDEYLKHDRDLDFPYAGIKQLCDKYLVQNRLTKEIYETPQFVYMLIAMVLFKDYESKRFEYIKRAYNYFSKHKINLPTPIMAGVRTTTRSFASCALFDIDDNLNSIFANTTAIGKATAGRYGIGFNFGRLRAINTPIRNGEVVHTGVIPFLKVYESIVKSCQQIGVRGGSATAHCPWWHYEIEDVLVLKNNAGTDDNRVRKLDYSIGLDKVFYERFIKDKTVTLFSPHEVPELYNSFGLPNFKEVYEKCEKNPKIKYKKVVNAKDIMLLLARERYETARIYVMNVDHANDHSPWKEQVTASNLCLPPETVLNVLVDSIPMNLPIEEVVELFNTKKSIQVMSKNLDTNVIGFNQILNASCTGTTDDLIKITDDKNGCILYCTPDHEIYTKNRGYVPSKDLQSYDILDIIGVASQ